MRSPTLLPMRMNAADTKASSAIADCTPLTVVSRSCTTDAIDTFINDVSTTSTNIAIASKTARRVSPAPTAGASGRAGSAIDPASPGAHPTDLTRARWVQCNTPSGMLAARPSVLHTAVYTYPRARAGGRGEEGCVRAKLRWVFRRRLCFGGLAGALVFFCLSLTPSLLPRGDILQGVLSGVTVVIGYGVGSAVSAGVRKF